MADLRKEIERRRTFAIISHPDAGKTTLTEKLLLYGGAIQSAGSVKGKQGDKHAVSDRLRQGQGHRAPRRLRLDGAREAARHFHHLLGDAV